MIVLSFVWLLLVVAELVWGTTSLFEVFGTVIWIVFIAEFALRLVLAPDQVRFLRASWLTEVALVAPALRMFAVLRVLRFARALRGVRLVSIVGTANRSMNALRRTFGRRGVGFVLIATLLVALLGAAGMLAFEPASEVPGGFTGYGDALWWTTMVLTSIGSTFWPVTAEGRVLCVLLSVYGFTVFGYITATPGSNELAKIRTELALMRAMLRAQARPQEVDRR